MSETANRTFERHRAELDVTHHASPQDLRGAFALVAAGAIAAALLGAAPLHDWALNLSLDWGPAAEPVARAAEAWHGWMEALGVTGVHETLHAWLESLRFASW